LFELIDAKDSPLKKKIANLHTHLIHSISEPNMGNVKSICEKRLYYMFDAGLLNFHPHKPEKL